MKYVKIDGELTQLKNEKSKYVIIALEVYFTNDEYCNKMFKNVVMGEFETREEAEEKLNYYKQEYKDCYEMPGEDMKIVEC